MKRISIAEKFAGFAEQWQPKIVAELNGHEVKLVKVQGTFPWHRHDDADELFMVWRGRFRVEFRNRIVELGPGELVIIPRGVRASDRGGSRSRSDPAGAGWYPEHRQCRRRKVHGAYGCEDLKTMPDDRQECSYLRTKPPGTGRVDPLQTREQPPLQVELARRASYETYPPQYRNDRKTAEADTQI
jgi:hypothetical protein